MPNPNPNPNPNPIPNPIPNPNPNPSYGGPSLWRPFAMAGRYHHPYTVRPARLQRLGGFV